jgi:hypothetical protein
VRALQLFVFLSDLRGDMEMRLFLLKGELLDFLEMDSYLVFEGDLMDRWVV